MVEGNVLAAQKTRQMLSKSRCKRGPKSAASLAKSSCTISGVHERRENAAPRNHAESTFWRGRSAGRGWASGHARQFQVIFADFGRSHGPAGPIFFGMSVWTQEQSENANRMLNNFAVVHQIRG
jgi:hypothetical protein